MVFLESGRNVSISTAVCDVEDIMDTDIPIVHSLGSISGRQHRGQIFSDELASDTS